MTTAQEIHTYQSALKEARGSFDRASQRLKEISMESSRLNREINKLRRTITALAAMCSESPLLDSMGITDSCAEVMENETCEVTSQDVVKGLENMGFDMSSQKNPSASVHAVLSRLAAKGRIKKIVDERTEAVTWRGPRYSELEITDDDIPF
jgi:hypothetical protein